MREIVLGAKATQLTKYTIDALAWATNRRGHNKWQGVNVGDIIYQYLLSHDVDLSVLPAHTSVRDPRMVNDIFYINPQNLKYTMKRLEAEGYAILEVKGKRFVSFEFKPDVILTGHGVRFVEKPVHATEVHHIPFKRAGAPTAGAPTDIVLPMPEIPHTRYHATELNELLDRWAERDPEAYAKYADALETTLGVLLDG
jgi:hypothetical protein